MAVSYPPRNKVEKRQTWNAESVFKNHKAWEEEVKNISGWDRAFEEIQREIGRKPRCSA